MRTAIAVTAVAMSMVGITIAADVTAAVRKSTDIAAQPLSSALKTLADERDFQVLYVADTVGDAKTGGVRGNLTVLEALDQLLQGTGRTYRVLDEQTVMIAQADGQGKRASSPGGGESLELEEILVTGSRLSRSSVEGPAPVNVYSREAIERSGQSTLADFLSMLPEVSLGSPENGVTASGETSVRLRGLPLGTTLVLINGRRLEGGGVSAYSGGFFDLNAIPASVIDRIEIVPEGSSAVYGSDAMAGVLNIILKQDFEGVQAGVRYGAASGVDETTTDVAMGHAWERGSVSLVGSYFSRNTLHDSERAIASSPAFGTLIERCNPGNVYSTNGANLPGLSAPSAGITEGGFSAGESNRCRQYEGRYLVPPAQRATMFAYGNYQLTSNVELFTEIMFTRHEQDIALPRKALSNVIVPASNAFNPFGTSVRVNYTFDTPAAWTGYEERNDFFRPLLGARGNLPGVVSGWDWEVTAWQSRTDTQNHHEGGNTNSAALTAALASGDPNSALNVFTTGAPASDAVLASIYSPADHDYLSTVDVLNAFVRGSLFDLPAGPVKIVIGGEFASSELRWESTLPTPSRNFRYRRDASSAFTEVRVPLLANRSNPRGGDMLAMTAAARYDGYDDFGSHVTPQFALEWRPWESLLVRGAYAEAYKAPNFVYVYAPRTTTVQYCCINDPQQGGAATPYDLTRGGNPDLDPETGESRSVGLVWSPGAIEGLSASLTWWQIDQTDRVTGLQPEIIVANESLFPGHVRRDPVTNVIQLIDISWVNFGELQVAGLDLGVNYSFTTPFGTFAPRLSATRTYRYRAALTPGAPLTDRLSKGNADAWAPDWKGVVGMSWERGAFSANVQGRYVSDYLDYQETGPTSRELGNFWLWDVSGKVELGAWLDGKTPLRGAFLQVGMVNALDSRPVYSAFNYGLQGYDSSQYDIRGRFIYASLGVKF